MNERDLPILDEQMARWTPRLESEVRVNPMAASCLASTLAREAGALDSSMRSALHAPHRVTMQDRLAELVAFQGFMDLVHTLPPDPRIVRAQVLAQNYVCFVYLGDSCFKALRKVMPSGTTTRRCAAYLTNNPIRAFRNAVAHASWRYKSDFSGLEFWARKGGKPDEPLVHWEASQEDLSFWQALARCVAYSVLPAV